ncbi:hypothetical protein C8J42_103133 [Sphingomonas sp. PP-CE-1A-559]|nr:hypothetical protein C8J42_103133 [Sphingomonas sp. PP-CE-1A-559]
MLPWVLTFVRMTRVEMTGRNYKAPKRNRARHRSATGPTPLPRCGTRKLSRGNADYGSITVSTTWITPFDCMTFAIVILPLWPLPSMMPQPVPTFLNISGSPCTVV